MYRYWGPAPSPASPLSHLALGTCPLSKVGQETWTWVGWAVAGVCGPHGPGWEPARSLGKVHLASQSQAELLFIVPGTWLVYFKLHRSPRRADSKLRGGAPRPPSHSLSNEVSSIFPMLPGPHPSPAWHEALHSPLQPLAGVPIISPYGRAES